MEIDKKIYNDRTEVPNGINAYHASGHDNVSILLVSIFFRSTQHCTHWQVVQAYTLAEIYQ